MATIRIPIDFRNPRVSSFAGNSFFTVTGLTVVDGGHWEFAKDVDGKIYGIVHIPTNVAATTNGKIILAVGANLASGITTLQISTKAIGNTESLNPSALTAESSQDITLPSPARTRTDVTFPAAGFLSEALASGDLLWVEVAHLGSTSLTDTLTVNTELWQGLLEVSVS